MKVFFDNAGTTPLDPAVFEEMRPFFEIFYGNPSSIHSHGREVRSAVERARKKIADILNTSPSEIFFTSGGTEADNTAIINSVKARSIKNVISSRIEHHAVLHTLDHMEQEGWIKTHFVNLHDDGQLDYDHLQYLLKSNKDTMISLMQANNEIGNVSDIHKIGQMCKEYGAVFHSDTVQTMGHFKHDLQELQAHCIVGSAHKLHGPKGIGFLYKRHDHPLKPFIHGGAQERNMRGGTENVTGIVGLAKALEIAYKYQEEHKRHIKGLKERMINKLKTIVPDVNFNGTSSDLESSLYTVLNVCMPASEDNDMLLFNLDINGVSVSGGSACSSGASVGSHVLAQLKRNPNRGAIRFSFSKYNTEEEVDYAVEKLAETISISS